MSQLPLTQVLDTIECRCCYTLKPFTVRNALWRIGKASDWDAFFKCVTCWKARKRKRADLKAEKTAKTVEAAKSVKKVTKARKKVKKMLHTHTRKEKKVAAQKKRTEKVVKVVAKVQSPPANDGFTNKPFENLRLVEVN